MHTELKPTAHRRRRVVALVILAFITAGGLLAGATAESPLSPVAATIAPVRPGPGLPVSSHQAQTPGAAATLSAREQAVAAGATAGLVSDIYRRLAPSVVAVHTVRTTDELASGGAAGTGFVLDEAGHIVTNNHVVRGAAEVFITAHSGETMRAEVVGRDMGNDLAVLKAEMPAGFLPPAPLGDSDSVEIGDLVLAIGHPYGFDFTATAGIISGRSRVVGGRTGRMLRGMLQTDAALNPGNSGGPLIHQSGVVIGVNTAVSGQANTADRIGFAIPINTVKRVWQQLVAGEPIDQPYLGVSLVTVSPTVARQLDVPVGGGAAVMAVVPGSPAARAGLRGVPSRTGRQDGNPEPVMVIVAVDGHPVREANDLINYLAERRVGDRVSLTIRSGDEEQQVRVSLGRWPSE